MILLALAYLLLSSSTVSVATQRPDPSQTPHMKATELYKHFGVGQSTGQGKSKQIRDIMKMHPQPSDQDTFELLAIEKDVDSEWMMYHGEDLAGHVRRKSDGQEFYLGLAEIKAVDEESLNYQRLDDYAVWFVNNR